MAAANICRRHDFINAYPYVHLVCRPGWLVEVECMAVKTIENNQFAAF